MRMLAFIAAFLFCAAPAIAADTPLADPQTGAPAPVFKAADTNGRTQDLAAHKGKIVVLEWTNADCPYVKKHYASGNMQALQKSAVEAGAVWLRINSSASGKQGHLTADASNALAAEQKVAASATILDESGDIGRLYGAKTTPTMAVIDKAGTLAYLGAIDDKPTSDAADIPGAKNYVAGALADLAAGRPVAESKTKGYGCAVKY